MMHNPYIALHREFRNAGLPELALDYLQDYAPLLDAVRRWPELAAQSTRPAVRLLSNNASRDEIVTSLARERDCMMAMDEKRIQTFHRISAAYRDSFGLLVKRWKVCNASLAQQHSELCVAAQPLRKESFFD
jgi:hypothetical protein